MFQPKFAITPALTRSLMQVEAARQALADLPIDVAMLASLRETAQLRATHFSTQIEGNRLTEAEVRDVLRGAHFPGRERDEAEVRSYWRALAEAERLAASDEPLSERAVRGLHGLVMTGRKRPTPYRDGQNVIRDAESRKIVYMPPEAKDVPGLMADLAAWFAAELDRRELPAPMVAALAHYQFAAIHPYYDGNGRTARLLATVLLHRAGYGLKGLYALDEHYARDLPAYYRALSAGPSHNYYFGRAEADLTGFLEYFCHGMADAFSRVRAQAASAAARGAEDRSALLRTLDPKQRRLLPLFRRQGTATTAEIAQRLGLSVRTCTVLCRQWIADGFLEFHDPSKKARAYRLGARVGSL